MKELVRNITAEEYHNKVYPQILEGTMVGQWTLDNDILLFANPERYPSTRMLNNWEFSKLPCGIERHPLQGEFQLGRPTKVKPLRFKK